MGFSLRKQGLQGPEAGDQVSDLEGPLCCHEELGAGEAWGGQAGCLQTAVRVLSRRPAAGMASSAPAAREHRSRCVVSSPPGSGLELSPWDSSACKWH